MSDNDPKLPEFPAFSQLPVDPNGPRGNAWGLWGKDDSLGMLNLLTPSNTKLAAQEIQTGVRISMDWSMDNPKHPSFNRKPFKHTITPKPPRAVNDDTIEFNTQGSSQWDGFRHFAYQDAKLFYNGRTQQQIESGTEMGLDAWVNKGGIVGRGVLLDYASYAAKHNLPTDPLTSVPISPATLQSIASSHNISFRHGDLLFIRSGFTKHYSTLSSESEISVHQRPKPQFIGVEACKETLEWIWENKFSAVAGDMPSFEQAPIDEGKEGNYWRLHEWLLAGWGLPIGEMFDLEALAEECERTGRWTFFVSSVPLKVPGGVASPPCAVAIF